ncbi:MAG: hypothetical protein H6Q20_2445 [Bacteroidetes bacterium]|nr:hypothetical protein [Bacteroidota bacterium]
MRVFKKIYIIFVLPVLLYSCADTSACREETEVNVQINFYERTYITATKKYAYNALTVDSIWAKGLDLDSFLYKKKLDQELILVPLRKTENQSDFTIRFNNTTDTVSIFYQNNDKFYLSLECGCIVVHTIDEVLSTGHFIDSVAVINREVINSNAENIQLYHF